MKTHCLIIPCFNEEKRFPMARFQAYYDNCKNAQFCFVNDGSTDGTQQRLEEFRKGREARVLTIQLPQNLGKGEAVRQGLLTAMEQTDAEVLGYFDADLATPLEETTHLLQVMAMKETTLLVFGSRVKVFGRVIERSFVRHYFGRIFATAASVMLDLPIYDTQCGAKIMKREIVPLLFNESFLSQWLFDVEIFFRMMNQYQRNNLREYMTEIPLNSWIEKGESRVSFTHALKVPFELNAIYWKYKRTSNNNALLR